MIELDVPDDEGTNLCAQGLAEPVGQKQSERSEKRPAAKRTTKRGE